MSVWVNMCQELKLWCDWQVGAQVMLLRNLELTGNDRMLVNGSRGVITKFIPKTVGTPFPPVSPLHPNLPQRQALPMAQGVLTLACNASNAWTCCLVFHRSQAHATMFLRRGEPGTCASADAPQTLM